MANEQTAVFGGGCFWCIEAIFQRLSGVSHVESGYMGGHVDNPTYLQVCGGDTGHVEVVRVMFDPDAIVCTQAFACGVMASWKRAYGLWAPLAWALIENPAKSACFQPYSYI